MARDAIHEAVRTALEGEGWVITHDPYKIVYGIEQDTVYVDLAAQRVLAATREDEKIAVEIKTFGGKSIIHDFQQALGQYILYRDYLAELEPDRYMVLAVNVAIYESYLVREAFQLPITKHNLTIVCIDIDTMEIIKWIK